MTNMDDKLGELREAVMRLMGDEHHPARIAYRHVYEMLGSEGTPEERRALFFKAYEAMKPALSVCPDHAQLLDRVRIAEAVRDDAQRESQKLLERARELETELNRMRPVYEAARHVRVGAWEWRLFTDAVDAAFRAEGERDG
jgi:hypothetical protein